MTHSDGLNDWTASDEALVGRARNGDQAAFQELVDRRVRVLRARVRKRLPQMVRRKISESDVMQEAYLTAFEKLDQFENQGEGSFGRWLDRIVEFKVKEVIRRYLGTEKRDTRREISGAHRPETAQHRHREPTPSTHAMAHELEGQVRTALTQLSESHREVIRLVQQQGYPLAEVGRLMGRSEQAAAQLYSRALGRLARLVERSRRGPAS